MSEWVDFGLYALQAVLLWIVLPAWGARFLRPLAAAVPARGGGAWIPALRAWGILSVLLLLACRLDRAPPPLSAAALRKPGWEALLMTSNLLLALGLAFAGYGALRLVRWLKQGAAARDAGAAETFPLTRDDFLSRGLQRLTLALVLAALLARPVAALFQTDRAADVLGNFITGLVIATLLFAAAGASVMRSPNALDRLLGERWRRTEVRLCYLLMANLALLEIAVLLLGLAGLGSRRAVALLVAALVCATLAGLMLLSRDRTAPSEGVMSLTDRK